MNLSVGMNELPGPHVLVIEDDPPVRDFLRECLELLGCVVTAVDNGVTAVDELRTGDFDLILSDVHLPDTVAPELIPRLKAVNPAIPIIVITGSLVDFEERTRLLGAPVLVKPVSIDALCATVRRALEHTAPAGRSR